MPKSHKSHLRSWWMFQVQPSYDQPRESESHLRQLVDGSDPAYFGYVEEAVIEPSTSWRRWDSKEQQTMTLFVGRT